MTNDELYSEIEHSIIVWSNDGTKTAGTLTRQIMEIVNKSKQNTYTKEQMKKCWEACERYERPKSEGYAPNFEQFIQSLKHQRGEGLGRPGR